jgi:hypothetical protein
MREFVSDKGLKTIATDCDKAAGQSFVPPTVLSPLSRPDFSQ